MKLGKKLGLAALLAFITTTTTQAMVLDSFDYDVALQGSATNGVSVDSGILTGVTNTIPAGDVVYTLTSTSDATIGAQAGATLGAGELYLFNTNGTSNLTLSYFDLNGGPISGLDITDGGLSDQFYFDIEFIDLGFFLDIIVQDIYSQVSTVTYSQTDAILLSDPTERVYAAFSDFVGVADFSAVGQITAVIRGTTAGADLTISEVGTANVPEPSTVAIFGLALVGFAFSSRRKAK